MAGLQAIETRYKGYRFRSRLEARWAVFFDTIGIEWVYESQGFQLSDGSLYLPDFWLPKFCEGMWAEVKPETGNADKDWDKARQLCHDSHRKVWCCEGVPDFREYTVFTWEDRCANCGGHGNRWSSEDHEFTPCLTCNSTGVASNGYVYHSLGIPLIQDAIDDHRMFWEACWTPEEIHEYARDDTLCTWRPGRLEAAVYAARGARFEHGEGSRW